MYFKPYPKEDRQELFDREKELGEIIGSLQKGERLVLILGIRRVGKTSVLNVALKEAGYPYIKVDASKLVAEGASVQLLYRELSDALSRISGTINKLKEFLKRVKGLRVGPLGIEFDLRGKPALVNILDAINEWALESSSRFVIAFDEAQNLRFLQGKGIDFLEFFKYTVDNLEGVSIILTGSEVGLLYDFLRLENPSSPLYGRFIRELTIERFTKEQSIEFLEAGFNEVGMKVERKELEFVVRKLSGIVGWLTLFGYVASEVRRVDKKAVEYFMSKAVKLAEEELRKLAERSKRYISILKAISKKMRMWSEIKEEVERIEGVIINDASFDRSLKMLIKMGYVEKRRGRYCIVDPIIEEAVKKMRIQV